MKSKAAISNGQGQFKIDEIEIGLPDPHEVLIKIKAALSIL